MNETGIFRALANETRLNILKWLREPGKNFPPQGIHIPEGDSFENSVCVGSICDRAGLSQSVISWNPPASANGPTTAGTKTISGNSPGMSPEICSGEGCSPVRFAYNTSTILTMYIY